MLKRFLVPLAIVAAAPFLLAACGGDDSSDEDDITAAIETAATSDAAENCTEVQTDAFNDQTEFAAEGEGTASCEENAGDGDVAADSVTVDAVEVDGDTASAEVAFEGGNLNGQVIAVGLVKEDDQWKLDSLQEFVTFDKAAFTEGLVAEASADGETPQQVIDCVEQTIDAASAEEVQQIYLSGDEQQLFGLFGECFTG
jgi:hypothetical protein